MSEDARSWWSTLPGLITAAAALLTAVTGLAVALNQIGVLAGAKGHGSNRGSAASATTPQAGPRSNEPGTSPTSQAEAQNGPDPANAGAAAAQKFESTVPLGQPIRLGDVSYEI